MSSIFSVKSFSKNQITLNSAYNALCEYMVIATFWVIGCCLVLGSQLGLKGVLFALLANGLVMGWIYNSYIKAFAEIAKKNNMVMPTWFDRNPGDVSEETTKAAI
jgi:hypothetical protein